MSKYKRKYGHCIDCNKPVTRKEAKRCRACNFKWRKTGALAVKTICKCGGRKSCSRAKQCLKCYRKSIKNPLPSCKSCKAKLSKHESTTGYCQKCYKGAVTKRWNHELTDEERYGKRCLNPEYTEWRNKVYERDSYTCVKCGDNKGGNLNAHHIESWFESPEKRFELDNGVTLCEDCHKDFHKVYGYGNNNRKQYNQWLHI